jgi:hypothetical protein
MFPVTMEPPVIPDGEATLAGAGRRAVSLNDVEATRRASVLAYCARLCEPDRIGEATDAVFAALRDVLEAARPGEVVEVDRALLEATRDAAAPHTSAVSGGWLGQLRTSRTCELMPTLLAGRASERLSDSDRDRVDRHLSRCAACRELERRRDDAERAYMAMLEGSAEPRAAREPFATPGDSEPDVYASRAAENGAGEPHDEGEGFFEEVDAEPVLAGESAVAEAEAEAEADEVDDEEPLAVDAQAEAVEVDDDEHLADHGEPEDFEDDEPLEDGAESEYEWFPDAEHDPEPEAAAPGDTAEYDARAEFDGLPQPEEPGSERRRGPSRGVIAAMFVAGVVILGIGISQLGDDDGGPSDRAAADRPAQRPAATPPAEPAPPSRAELRTRARLEALGDRDLARGHSGDDVKALQRLLGVSTTGNYAVKTEYAVKQFQESHGLPATGIADEATKRRLARRPRPPAQAPTPPESELQTQGAVPQSGGL